MSRPDIAAQQHTCIHRRWA